MDSGNITQKEGQFLRNELALIKMQVVERLKLLQDPFFNSLRLPVDDVIHGAYLRALAGSMLTRNPRMVFLCITAMTFSAESAGTSTKLNLS